MLTHIIDNRGKEFSTLVKLGDLLGRSLRENVEMFTLQDGRVTYLTESGRVIEASYSVKNPIHLYNIKIEESDVLEDKSVFSTIVDKKVGKLLDSILESDYPKADENFDSVLGLWETRLNFDRIKTRLQEKSERFGPQNYIIDTEEFSRLAEVKDDLVKFLKENSEIVEIPEVKNAVKLAAVVSKSFDLPKITYEKLSESGFYYKNRKNDNLYEHLCKQELLTKELLEGKNSFETSWASNPTIAKLSSLIYSTDNDSILTAIAECIAETPYFALATKKQLFNIISNNISIEISEVSDKDIIEYVSKIYESKKPVKSEILSLLSEKYGTNISNLKEVPTFKALLNTEVVIFESLSRLAPKASVLKKVLAETSNMLKLKNGVESIDVADFLNDAFSKAGYKNDINETSLMQYMDFNQVADDLAKIGQVLKMLRPIAQQLGGGAMGGGGAGMGGGQPIPGQGAPQPGMGGDPHQDALPEPEGGIGMEGQYEDDIDPGMGGVEGGEVDSAAQDPDAAAAEANAEADMEEGGLDVPEADAEEEGAEGEYPLGDEEEATEHMGQEELLGYMSELDELMAMLKSDMGVDSEEGGEEGLEGDEEGFPEEGEEDSDDVHVDVNVDADDNDEVDIGGDDEGGEEPDKKFEKNTEKKLNKDKKKFPPKG